MKFIAGSRGIFVAVVLSVTSLQAGSQDRAPGSVIEQAQWTSEGALMLPENADRWITVGTGIGGEYRDAPFDPENPGTIGVVQMEPVAYDYFLEHGEYADGTMFLLSFYRTLEKPDPALPGFMQGDLLQREIHVIDSSRFPEEGRGFYVYRAGATSAPAPMPLGSVCFVCHTEHGAYNGTFVQFYPLLREHFVDLTN